MQTYWSIGTCGKCRTIVKFLIGACNQQDFVLCTDGKVSFTLGNGIIPLIKIALGRGIKGICKVVDN